tara:strand:+ start:1244 stop:2986 length:1743 start_codon:yes stop_codon:yes gene_type:complete
MRRIITKILPPIIKDIARVTLNWFKRRKLKYDARRWDDKTVTKSTGIEFIKLFEIQDVDNKKFFAIRHEEEIKDTILIPPKKNLKFKLRISQNPSDIIFSYTNLETEAFSGKYEVFQNNNPIASLEYPRVKLWNRQWLKYNGNSNFEIKNNTDRNMYFAQPVLLFNCDSTSKSLQNIFIVVLDQVDEKTFDELYENNSIPNIKKFFSKNSLHFKNCLCPGEWTVPCFNSIFTGQTPSVHGFYDLKHSASLKKIIPENNLIKYLKQNNFHSFGIVKSKGHNQNYEVHGYFDRYLFFDDIPGKTDDDDDTFISKTIDNLESHKKNKNFVFLHFMKTHSPYYMPSYYEEKLLDKNRTLDPSKEFSQSEIGFGDTKIEVHLDETKFNQDIKKRQMVRLRRTDMLLGQLFDYIDKNHDKNSITILTADHGLPHGVKQDKILNDSWINIPFRINFSDLNKFEFTQCENFISTTDTFNLIKHFIKNDQDLDNLIFPFNNNFKPEQGVAITESIFNEKYKVAVGNNFEIFRLSCYFDPIRKNVHLSKLFKKNLYKDNIEINLSDKRYAFFLEIIKNNLKKSKILNLII